VRCSPNAEFEPGLQVIPFVEGALCLITVGTLTLIAQTVHWNVATSTAARETLVSGLLRLRSLF
jgi:hypothetical protein